MPTFDPARWDHLAGRIRNRWHLHKDFLEYCRAFDIKLLVIDSLRSFFAGKSESDAAAMREWIKKLRGFAAFDINVIVLHHPNARGAPRGSGVLAELVDAVIRLEPCPGAGRAARAGTDRRRRLRVASRLDRADNFEDNRLELLPASAELVGVSRV